MVWERIAHERNFSLSCLANLGGGQRCGVAWNTLFLGLMTATSTTLLGTLMALMAERASRRLTKRIEEALRSRSGTSVFARADSAALRTLLLTLEDVQGGIDRAEGGVGGPTIVALIPARRATWGRPPHLPSE